MHQPIRALLVIDQPALSQVVRLALSHGAYLTQKAVDAEGGRAALQDWHPHVAIVDMDLDRGRILERLGYTSPAADRPPAIALTRRVDLRTKLAAFDQGVDDILTVPFSPEELVARMLVMVRRTYRDTASFTRAIRVGELEMDLVRRHVRMDGEELHLTTLEHNLLYLLAANAGQVLSREEILDHIWGADYIAESNVVDRHIGNLRAKLGDHRDRPPHIATVSGQGYLFVAPKSSDESSVPRPD